MVITRWQELSGSIGVVNGQINQGDKFSDVSTDHPPSPTNPWHIVQLSSNYRSMSLASEVQSLGDRYRWIIDLCLFKYYSIANWCTIVFIDVWQIRLTWAGLPEMLPASHGQWLMTMGNLLKMAQNTLQVHRVPTGRTVWLEYRIIWSMMTEVWKLLKPSATCNCTRTSGYRLANGTYLSKTLCGSKCIA